MKSNWRAFSVTDIEKQINQGVERELVKYKDEIYAKVEWDCFCQALACCFTALELMGWRKKRLTEFKDKIDDVTHMMYTGVMGREFSPHDALQHLKAAYGIDLMDSQYLEEYERDVKKGAANDTKGIPDAVP